MSRIYLIILLQEWDTTILADCIDDAGQPTRYFLVHIYSTRVLARNSKFWKQFNKTGLGISVSLSKQISHLNHPTGLELDIIFKWFLQGNKCRISVDIQIAKSAIPIGCVRDSLHLIKRRNCITQMRSIDYSKIIFFFFSKRCSLQHTHTKKLVWISWWSQSDFLRKKQSIQIWVRRSNHNEWKRTRKCPPLLAGMKDCATSVTANVSLYVCFFLSFSLSGAHAPFVRSFACSLCIQCKELMSG